MKVEFSQILKDLNIPKKDALVYFHISADKLKPFFTTKDILKGLDSYFDSSSTYFLPSFPFSGNGYHSYLEFTTIFDIRKTPCKVNLISEIFRRNKDTIRSLHPWLSVAGKGIMASKILNQQHEDTEIFGKKSPFYKIMQNNGYVVGLGVDCNTNSFAHMPDELMKDLYNFPVYDKKIYSTICINYEGHKHTVNTMLLDKNISKNIKPRKLKKLFSRQDFYREKQINEIDFYSLKIKDSVQFTYEQCIENVKIEGKPIYYE